MTDSSYLSAIRERVVVFDGASGTWLQGHDLGPDDFGGDALEGCNEILCDTRPELITGFQRSISAATDCAMPSVVDCEPGSLGTTSLNRRPNRSFRFCASVMHSAIG